MVKPSASGSMLQCRARQEQPPPGRGARGGVRRPGRAPRRVPRHDRARGHTAQVRTQEVEARGEGVDGGRDRRGHGDGHGRVLWDLSLSDTAGLKLGETITGCTIPTETPSEAGRRRPGRVGLDDDRKNVCRVVGAGRSGAVGGVGRPFVDHTGRRQGDRDEGPSRW
ncbi:hypothetical protein THAOC_18719, partial [Thalassiosira oceanica]